MLAKKIFPAALFLAYSWAFVSLIMNKKMLLFIHPDFLPLAYFAVIALVSIAFLLLVSRFDHHHFASITAWKFVALLLPLIAVFFFDLKPLSSVAALDRGLDAGALTIGRRVGVGQFATKPENRTLYQWIIALSADPEPTHYEGQKVNIRGFLIHDTSIPPDQVRVAKFILTCCAADARVLSLAVKKDHPLLTSLGNDEWVEVQGTMRVIESEGHRSLLVIPDQVTHISIPENPYEI